LSFFPAGASATTTGAAPGFAGTAPGLVGAALAAIFACGAAAAAGVATAIFMPGTVIFMPVLSWVVSVRLLAFASFAAGMLFFRAMLNSVSPGLTTWTPVAATCTGFVCGADIAG